MGLTCGKEAQKGGQKGGCGCGSNSSSVGLYGGYKYGRKASLASRRRLQNRMSMHTRKKKKGKKGHNKKKHRRTMGRRRHRGRSSRKRRRKR